MGVGMLKYFFWFPGYLILSISYFSSFESGGRRSVVSSSRVWKYKDFFAPLISIAFYTLIGVIFLPAQRPTLSSDPHDLSSVPSNVGQDQPSEGNTSIGSVPTQQDAPPLPPPTPLIIAISPMMQTETKTIEVSGMVLGTNHLSHLKVDGKQVSPHPDGSFNFKKSVPIGNSELKLVAIDEQGRTAEATISVTRSIPVTDETAYPPLNPGGRNANPRPEAIALVIGVDEYENAPAAEFGENDARSFYDYASNSLGIPPDRIKLLTGAEARRLDIQKAVQNWVKPLIVQGKSDVFVFFSGHGLSTDDGSDMFLLPYDGDRNLLVESSIRRKDMIAAIAGGGALSLTLFLDTCYSGGTRGSETLVPSARPIMIRSKDEDVPPNVTIIAASGNNQLSSVLAPTKHGLYSYYLMRGLEGEASGNGHAITASEMLEFLSKHVPAEAAKIGRVQTPQLVGDGGKIISSW